MKRSGANPLWYLGAGLVAAGLLAVVLFAGLGTDGSAGSSAAGQPLANPNLVPGVNAPTSLMLSLSVLHGQAPAAGPFHLTDQYGRPVSPAEFRGKAVVISFNDDECVDLCTFLANDIVAANHDLGRAAKDVVWLSVNVNPFHPQVAQVRAWTDAHGLGGQPNWYFGTASPAALRQVWKEYGVYVGLNSKARTVVHGAEMFFVGPGGRERAIGEFGTVAANTAQFAHGIAQVAADLLPGRVHVNGPEATATTKVPAFSLPYLLDGSGRFSLSAERGRYTVVNFYSSTCTVCRSELPHLEAVHRWAGGKVAFVGVDVADRAAAGRAMAARAGVTYPLVSDSNGTAAGAERITGIPFTLIVDPQGDVVVRHPGAFTTEQLKYLLENIVPALGASG